MKRYVKIWLIMTISSIQGVMSSRFGWLLFIFGKLMRFFLYFSFLFFLFSGTKGLLGYSKNQVLLFFLTFSVIGGFSQMFFREVYRFRQRVIAGDFDFDLLKPIHPLLRNLTGGFDVLDLLTLPIYVFLLVKTIGLVGFSPIGLGLYLLLALNGFFIIAALHILVLSLGIVTNEVDSAIMLYRDVENMARFPVNIYQVPMSQILTFVVPIGLIFTIPAQVLVGGLSWQLIAIAFVFGAGFVWLAFFAWNKAIRKYSSASS